MYLSKQEEECLKLFDRWKDEHPYVTLADLCQSLGVNREMAWRLQQRMLELRAATWALSTYSAGGQRGMLHINSDKVSGLSDLAHKQDKSGGNGLLT